MGSRTPVAEATDEELLGLAGRGRGEGAMAELYARYSGRVFGLGVRLLDAPGPAEDLVQETFLRVWRTAGRFDPSQGSAATFVFTIARRLAVDLWRRRSARPPDGAEARDEAVASGVERLLVALAVRNALEALSPAHRQVLELAYGSGLTQVEIAGRLRIPLGTVKTRTSHALRGLRAALGNEGVTGA